MFYVGVYPQSCTRTFIYQHPQKGFFGLFLYSKVSKKHPFEGGAVENKQLSIKPGGLLQAAAEALSEPARVSHHGRPENMEANHKMVMGETKTCAAERGSSANTWH